MSFQTDTSRTNTVSCYPTLATKRLHYPFLRLPNEQVLMMFDYHRFIVCTFPGFAKFGISRDFGVCASFESHKKEHFFEKITFQQ
jgi:hypothetical protein